MEDIAAAESLVGNIQAFSQSIANLTGEPVTVDLTVGSTLEDPKPGDLWRGRVPHKSGAIQGPSHVFRAFEETVTVPKGYDRKRTEEVKVLRWRSLCGCLFAGPTHAPNQDATPPHCLRCHASLDKLKRDRPDERILVQGYTTWTYMPNEEGSGGAKPWSTFGQSQEETMNDG